MVPLLHDHDVLVHASRAETFGTTIVEAVATGTPVLVAASEGPSETLSGLDGVAGTLFPVTKDPAVLVDAYRRLAELWPKLDPAAARARLAERYGYAPVGEQLLAVYREAPAASEPEPVATAAEPADRIAVVAMFPPNENRIRTFIQTARERGFGVDLIVPDPEKWAREAETGIRVHGVGAPTPAEGSPRPARLSGSPMPAALIRTLRVETKRLRRKVTGRTAAVTRPQALWRATRPVLPQIDMSQVRRVIVYGTVGERIGWQIARRYPGVLVTTTLELPPPDQN
jgi:glycogen(starch) synthase